jgi:CBS domain-containing protein
MKTAGSVLKAKGSEIFSVAPESTVYEALVLMAKRNVGAVLVLNSDGTIAGIFSERDYARKIVLFDKSSKETPVKEIMTKSVTSVQTTLTIEECMALMTEKRIRHLPVFEEKKLVGVLSIGDVVKAAIAAKDLLIDQIEHYISSSL